MDSWDRKGEIKVSPKMTEKQADELYDFASEELYSGWSLNYKTGGLFAYSDVEAGSVEQLAEQIFEIQQYLLPKGFKLKGRIEVCYSGSGEGRGFVAEVGQIEVFNDHVAWLSYGSIEEILKRFEVYEDLPAKKGYFIKPSSRGVLK